MVQRLCKEAGVLTDPAQVPALAAVVRACSRVPAVPQFARESDQLCACAGKLGSCQYIHSGQARVTGAAMMRCRMWAA